MMVMFEHVSSDDVLVHKFMSLARYQNMKFMFRMFMFRSTSTVLEHALNKPKHDLDMKDVY